MAWKHLKEQPPEWIDLPEFDEQGSRTDKEKNADSKIAKKIIGWSYELKEQLNCPIDKNDPVLNQLLRQIQSKQYAEINIQTILQNDSDEDQSTIFHFIYGKIISEVFIKDIQECNSTDVFFLRNSKLPPDSFHQLKSAIIIIFGVIIEHFIGENFQLNIGEALKLALKEMERNPSQNQQEEIEIFFGLMEISEKFEAFFALPQVDKVTLQEFLSELNIIKESAKIKEPEELDEFEKKYPPKTPLHNRIRYILELFQAIINQAIDIGLLDKFKASTIQKNENISIATNHLLLNEQKLLSRLNGDERSQRANQGKTQITNRLKQKIIELLKAHSNEKYKSINEAAEKLRLLLTPEIRQIIHDDQQSYQHNFQYSEDRYFEIIRDLIRADADLKSQYICKLLKNNK